MTIPRAFLSFDFDHDEVSKRMFAGQCAKDSPTPFNVSDWSSKAALPQSQWENLIRQKINKTNMVIVLVGRYMASATGVTKEIAMAKAQNVPVFGVYVDNAGPSSTLPIGLQRNRTVIWTWPNVGNLIKQGMREGKNAR
ncbi:hypothetical protein GCM10009557_05000 [Virgisporangium ochraceum]|uniref:Thoeris protein ThsB TIR-like domain-containing protein n=1 Tax=Virgisporangium ochraceum TaxID=65505 RepID=A0A8J3ZV34_9ACTN|nr:TIR domain-containing protein [Virgisporangium ochraceum]GIJ70201.1 hypothetical protein Voc01_051180 [Virgisporangium ochraceum]